MLANIWQINTKNIKFLYYTSCPNSIIYNKAFLIKTNLNFQDRDNASEETSTITIVLLSVLGAGITFISIFAIISILKKWYVVYLF